MPSAGGPVRRAALFLEHFPPEWVAFAREPPALLVGSDRAEMHCLKLDLPGTGEARRRGARARQAQPTDIRLPALPRSRRDAGRSTPESDRCSALTRSAKLEASRLSWAFSAWSVCARLAR